MATYDGFIREGYVVRVSENALIQLCLSGLEAYSVWHRQKGARTRLETYGGLWGHELVLPGGRMLYSVELATVDTSAERGHDYAYPVDGALELKRDVMTSFWPQYDFLGDFHTHPYKTLSEAVGKKFRNYVFSEADRERIEDHSQYWVKQNYRVGLVLTIAQMARASRREHTKIEEGTVEFTLGNYRLWLKAYVAYRENQSLKVSKDDEPMVTLDCPSLIGQTRPYTPFGRGTSGHHAGHRPGLIDAG